MEKRREAVGITGMEQSRMPIVEALTRHQRVERVSLHTPGHKAGRGLPAQVAHLAGPFAAWDATELPGLDDLYAARGPIEQAQALAAHAFGCDATNFLVGGSTAGNLAAILAVVHPGDVVLVGRNAHLSVWNGLQLARARVAVLSPPLVRSSAGLPLWGALSDGDLRGALRRHPDARALILTSPTYEGVVSDVAALVRTAHAADVVVLVDEAHGVHLPFHPDLPMSAVQAGADVVVHSAHKMAAALTQTAFQHVSGARVDPGTVRRALRTVQTSSPSYLLLASLDAVRAQLATEGRARIAVMIDLLREAQRLLERERPDLLVQLPGNLARDPFKWVLDAGAYGCEGCVLADQLRESYGIFVELCDERSVLLLWTYANSRRDVERVVDALLDLCPEAARGTGVAVSFAQDAWQPAETDGLIDMCPSAGATVWLPAAAAVGRRAAAPVIVYPPGVPLTLCGERFTERVCARLVRLRSLGVRVDGLNLRDGTVCCFKE